MIRLLPRSPRGTWLLAGAVWLAGVGGLWWTLPPAPRAEWRVPLDRERRHDTSPSVVAVVPDRRIVVMIGSFNAWDDVEMDDPPDFPLYRGPVQILDVGTNSERGRFFTPNDVFQEVRASPDSRWVALSGHDVRKDLNQNALVLIDLERSGRIDLPDAAYHRGVTRRFAFVPDRSAIVYAWRNCDSEGLRIWDLAGERVVGEIKDARPPVVVAEGGRALAFVAMPQGRPTIRIAELPSLRTLAEIPTDDQRVYDLNLSADGRRVAAAVEDREGDIWVRQSVHCWDTATGAELVGQPGGDGIRLTADGETLVTSSVSANPTRLVAWDLSSGRPRWERQLSVTAANLREDAVEPLRGCVTLIRWHVSPWHVIASWAERAGMNWPFSYQAARYSNELLDIESGRSVMNLPFHLDGAFPSPGGPIAVARRFDLAAGDAAPIVELWDLPPRKPLKWFAAGAGLLACPVVLLARRRSRSELAGAFRRG